MIADIIAEDRNEEPVLFVEIKTGIGSRAAYEQLATHLLTAKPGPVFGMLVDPEKITVVAKDADRTESLLELNSADVLGHYAPDYREQVSRRGTPGVFYDYLRVLVGAWLRDLADHWKSESPPGAEELSRIGLLDRLEGGTTRSEVALHGDPLS